MVEQVFSSRSVRNQCALALLVGTCSHVVAEWDRVVACRTPVISPQPADERFPISDTHIPAQRHWCASTRSWHGVIWNAPIHISVNEVGYNVLYLGRSSHGEED